MLYCIFLVGLSSLTTQALVEEPHVLLDGTENAWKVYESDAQTPPEFLFYDSSGQLIQSDNTVQFTPTHDSRQKDISAIYTTIHTLPKFDNTRCTQRRIKFTTTLDWRDDVVDIKSQIGAGFANIFVLGSDEARPGYATGLQFQIAGGSYPMWLVYPNRDILYPFVSIGHVARYIFCWIREPRNPCLYADKASEPLLRNATFKIEFTTKINVMTGNMTAERIIVQKAHNVTGVFEPFVDFTNDNTNKYMTSLLSKSWLGTTPEPPIFYVLNHRTTNKLTNYRMTALDLCVPLQKSMSPTTKTQRPAQTPVVSTVEPTTLKAVTTTTTVTEFFTSTIESLATSITFFPSTTGSVGSVVDTSITDSTTFESIESSAPIILDQDSGFPLIVLGIILIGACGAMFCLIITCYMFRKRIRESRCFGALYYSVPGGRYICCCFSAKMPTSKSVAQVCKILIHCKVRPFSRLHSPAEDYLNGLECELKRTDEPQSSFESPDSLPAPRLNRRITNTQISEDYGTLPVTSNDNVGAIMQASNSEYSALPAEAGQPATSRLSVSEKRARRRDSKNNRIGAATKPVNQYDRVNPRLSANVYEQLYSKAPAPSNTPSIIYDRAFGDNMRVQSMDISDVSTDLEASSGTSPKKTHYQQANSKFVN